MRLNKFVAPGAGSILATTDILGQNFANVLSSSIILRPQQFVFSFLKNGSSSAVNVNGSTTPVNFDYSPPDGFDFLVKDVNFLIQGNGGVTPVKFGNIAALTNGCLFSIADSNNATVLDFLGGSSIKNNSEFFLLAGGETYLENLVHVKWNILSTGAAVLIVNGSKLRFTVRDNLSSIGTFQISVQGLLMPSGMILPSEADE